MKATLDAGIVNPSGKTAPITELTITLSQPCASRIGGCIISMTRVRAPESSRSITFPIIKCCCTMRQTLPHSLYRLKNFFKQNYDEIVETIRLVAPYFDDFVLEPQEGNEEQIVLRWCQTGCEDIFNASQLRWYSSLYLSDNTFGMQPHDCSRPPSSLMSRNSACIPMQSRFSLSSCGSFPMKSRSLYPRNL